MKAMMSQRRSRAARLAAARLVQQNSMTMSPLDTAEVVQARPAAATDAERPIQNDSPTRSRVPIVCVVMVLALLLPVV